MIEKNKNDEDLDLSILTKYHGKKGLEFDVSNIIVANMSTNRTYQIYCLLNFEKVRSMIIRHLNDEFRSAVEMNEKELRESVLVNADNVYEDSLVKFIISGLIKASLDVLLDKSDEVSLKFARKYMGRTSYGIANSTCLKILRVFGNKFDLKNLKKYVAESYSTEERVLCAEAIIRISPTKENILALIKLGDLEVVKICLANFFLLRNKIPKNTLLDMLKDDNQYIRYAALNFIIENEYDLEKFLKGYAQNKYYYNIVVVLDRLLYSPRKISDETTIHIKNLENAI